MSYAEINAFGNSLQSLTKQELMTVAAQVDVLESGPKAGIIQAILQAIKNRKASLGRTSYGRDATI